MENPIECPEEFCSETFQESDECAVHLLSAHGWEIDKATVWLREYEEARPPHCCEECDYFEAERSAYARR